jgi:uncharacterized protein
MRKISKHALATALGTALIFTSVVPAIKAQEATPDISQWAIETLHEGEKYGIFPLEWYYEGFRTAISTERLNTLIDLTEKKIAKLNLEKNDQYTPAAVKGDTTRGDIINRLYNIVAQYDLEVADNSVAYLQQRQVLRGSDKGLMLDEYASTQDAVILAVRLIKDTYELAEQGAKGVAWVVEDEDTKIYLLGSIHLGIPDLYPFNKKLTDAFNESEGLFVEANTLDPEGMSYFVEKAMYADGTTIQEVISEEAYSKLEKVAKQLEISIEELALQKPWVISNNLSLLSMNDSFGLSVEEMSMHGIDTQFILSAMLQQKPIYELEGTKAQFDFLDSLSAEAQEQELIAVLDNILEPTGQTEEGIQLIASWFESWKNGDVETFKQSFTAIEGEPTEYSQMLFGKRDVEMAKKIVTVLEEEQGTYFLVVGAGHFLVDKNIRYHLEQSGYEVIPFYK